MKEQAEADRHRTATAVLCSVSGVGVLTAAAFHPELPEPRRFDHDGQVARMAGLAPQVRQSGGTRREGGLLKSGDARLRTVLVEAVWRWVRHDEAAARSYSDPETYLIPRGRWTAPCGEVCQQLQVCGEGTARLAQREADC